MRTPKVKIDAEFKSKIPPLSDYEFKQLEKNIVAEGCREPLIVWKSGQSDILLDGHNRMEICDRNDIPFEVSYKSFSDRFEAMNWMIDNQLGRRNLNPKQMSFLRGQRYDSEKKKGGRSFR